MPTPIRVLILEDRPDDAELVVLELRRAGFEFDHQRVDTEQAYLASLVPELDIILSDFSMPDFDAMRALSLLQATGLDIPFIVVTGSFEDRAIECMKRGAADYLIKDRLGRLAPAVSQAIHERDLRKEKREVEQALRASEARFRSVAESAVDALVLVDDKEEIGYWNPAAEQIFGYPEEEMLGQRLTMLLADQERGRWAATVESFRPARKSARPGRREEYLGRRKDGTQFPLELALSSWEIEGKAFLSASIRDLTESKQALRRAQLQDRLAAVGQLAAGIAHDFNNILGTIILYCELLLRYEGLPEKEQVRLNTMVQQAKRGANLISQILDFSRRSVVERHSMDLAPFMKEMVELLSRTLPENIRVNIAQLDERFIIEADPTRMQQVIMNLALNARDAMPAEGELNFTLDRHEFEPNGHAPFDGMPDRRWIRLRLQDTGAGITKEDLPHVFEPFFTTKAPREGTGLGLAQVYGIVKQHDGYVDVSSELGKGTIFTLYLPASPKEAGNSATQFSLEAAPGAGETILLVEDDEATRVAVAEILQSLEYRVISAIGGKQALEIYDRDPGGIDLVLSDLVMPEMGGRVLFEVLTEKYKEVKVLLMTGYPLGADTRDLLDRRKVAWLQKPFSSQSVARKVRDLLTQGT